MCVENTNFNIHALSNKVNFYKLTIFSKITGHADHTIMWDSFLWFIL